MISTIMYINFLQDLVPIGLIFLDLCVISRGAAVTIKCPNNLGEKELTKKLPGTMTVQKLKGLLQRLYKVDSSEQKLSYLDNRVSPMHYAISHKPFLASLSFPHAKPYA